MSKLTKNRLDNNTSIGNYDKATVRMVDGKAKLESVDLNFGQKSGFYYVTDYNRQCIYISYVGDFIGIDNQGFGHVVTSINRQRSAQMEELHGLLSGGRTLHVNYISTSDSFEMLLEFLESGYCKELKEHHALWIRQTIKNIKRGVFFNDFRPLKIIMSDVWL